MKISLRCLTPSLVTEARALAKKLNLSIYSKDQELTQPLNYLLDLSPTGLGLICMDTSFSAEPLIIDFTAGKAAHRRQFGGGKSQLIAKAVGIKRLACATIIDATAGFGTDAFVLATLGYSVILIERNPIIAALLADGIKRAAENPTTAHIAKRMTLYQGEASMLIPTLPKADIIYLDPMYPLQKKSALVKKELRIIRAFVGNDEDNTLLFNCACRHSNKVVVKRARKAPPIDKRTPTHIYRGKRSRFDVYVVINT